jgi:hypothetical protein
MDLQDAGMSVKFVLHDRDASFTAAFDAVFQAAGARVVRSAVQAPARETSGCILHLFRSMRGVLLLCW